MNFDIRLVLLLTCACTGIIFIFGWTFVIGRSPLRLFFIFFSQWMNRDTSDADKPIVVPDRAYRFRDTVLPQTVSNFDEVLRQQGFPTQDPNAPAPTPIPPSAQSAPESPAPYPRPLTDEELDSNHPFLKMDADLGNKE
jgi:hypothetical protein